MFIVNAYNYSLYFILSDLRYHPYAIRIIGFGRLDCEHESPRAMPVNHFHHTLFVITLSRFWVAVRLGDLCSKPDSVHIIMFRFM